MPSSDPVSASKARGTPRPRANVRRRPQAEREAQAAQEEQRRQERLAESAAGSTGPSVQDAIISDGRRRGRGGRVAQARRIDEDRIRAGDTGSVFGPAAAGAGPRLSRTAAGIPMAGLTELVEGTDPDGAQAEKSETQPEPAQTGERKTRTTSTSAAKTAVGVSTRDGSKNEFVYIDSDDEAGEAAIRDIERIWISSDEDIMGKDSEDQEDEDPIKSRAKQRSRLPKPGTGLRPVRAPRQLRPEEIERRNAMQGGKPEGFAEEMDLDEQFSTEVPSSPDLSKKSRRRNIRPRDTKVAVETAEEKAERLRYAEDLRKLKSIFAGSQESEKIKNSGSTRNKDDVNHPEEKRSQNRWRVTSSKRMSLKTPAAAESRSLAR